MQTLRRPVPAWLIVVAILVTTSITTAIFVAPSLLARPYLALKGIPAFQPVPIDSPEDWFFTINIRSVNNFSGIVSVRIVSPPSKQPL